MAEQTSIKSPEFPRVAASSWLVLVMVGGVITLFTFLGALFGLRELESGLLHLYQACYAVLESNQPIVSMVVSTFSLMAFASTGIGIVSGLAEFRRARSLVRSFRTRSVPPHPVVSKLSLQLGVPHQVTLVDDRAAYALTVGFLDPQVIISSGLVNLLEEDELEAVLRHESFHASQRDPLRQLFARSMRRALLFLPVTADLWARYAAAAELAADSHVVAAQGRDPLARALLKILTGEATRPAWAPHVGISSLLDLRLDHLLDPQAPGLPDLRWTRVAISAVVAALALGIIPMHIPPSFFDVASHTGLICTI